MKVEGAANKLLLLALKLGYGAGLMPFGVSPLLNESNAELYLFLLKHREEKRWNGAVLLVVVLVVVMVVVLVVMLPMPLELIYGDIWLSQKTQRAPTNGAYCCR